MPIDGNIVRCEYCHGTGKEKKETVGLCAEWVPCSACNGTGKQRV